MNVCGIDVSKDTLEVVVSKNKQYLKSKTFTNTAKGHDALVEYLNKSSVNRICLEATGNYHLDVALAIIEANMPIMVINPRAAHNFAKAMMQQTKTDAVDAYILAQFAYRMEFINWNAPDSSIFSLRACGRRLVSLGKDLTRAKNQLHALSLVKLTPKIVIEDVKLTISQLDNQIDKIIKYALEIIKASSLLSLQHKLLITMTGVADKTAIKLLGEIGVLSSDMSAKQWVAHAGLHPNIFQSGSSVNKKTKIGKSGNRYVREALYMSALNASYRNPNVNAYYLRNGNYFF